MQAPLRSIPGRPAHWGQYLATTQMPTWVPFMVSAITQGLDPEYAGNGISLTTDGNLLLYRRVSEREWKVFPALEGVKEVWLEFGMDYSDTSLC